METRLGKNLLDGELDFASLGTQVLTYNGDGTLNYVQVTIGTEVFRQTYSYTTGKVTGISAWIKQA